jgi:hypothetical protein
MVPPRLTKVLDQGRRCLLRLLLTTLVIIGSDAVVAALFKAREQTLHGAQGHREVGDDVARVGVLLPALKKSGYAGAQEEHVA